MPSNDEQRQRLDAGPVREVERLCGELVAELREMVELVNAHRQTIADGAWHAADRNHLTDDEAAELARGLARIAGCEDEIAEFMAEPNPRHWLSTQMQASFRPPDAAEPRLIPSSAGSRRGRGRDRRAPSPASRPHPDVTDRRGPGGNRSMTCGFV